MKSVASTTLVVVYAHKDPHGAVRGATTYIAQRRIYSCTKLYKTELLYYILYSKILVSTRL